MKSNIEIRKKIKAYHVKQWEIAQQIGISDGRFSVWLRTPLNKERRDRVLRAIESLSKQTSDD